MAHTSENLPGGVKIPTKISPTDVLRAAVKSGNHREGVGPSSGTVSRRLQKSASALYERSKTLATISAAALQRHDSARRPPKPARLDDITVFTYRQSRERLHKNRSLSDSIARTAKALKSRFMPSSVRPSDGPVAAEVEDHVEFTIPEYKLMLNPLSTFTACWDNCLLVLVLYTAVIIPWELAFELPDCREETFVQFGTGTCKSWFQDAMEIVVNIFFVADIFISFRTGFVDKKMVIHMGASDVARNYARSWFLFDLSGSLPLEMIAQHFLTGEKTGRDVMFLKLFKVVRLLRLGRLLNKAKVAANATRIFELTCGFFLVAHWAACVWYYVGRWQIEEIGSGNTFTGMYTWIQVPLSDDENTTYFHADIRTKYTASLYWAFVTMYTVGYGDIVPVTNFERSYTHIIQLLGCVSTALIFGNVALLIRKMDAAGARLSDEMDAVNEFIRFHNVQHDLAMRLRQTVEHKWHINQGIDVQEVLKELPVNIRVEIYMHSQAHVISANPLFAECSEKFIRALSSKLITQTHLADDFITWEQEASKEMFFLSKGKVALMSGDGRRIYSILSEGSLFGDFEVLKGIPRTASAQAITEVEVFLLTRRDLDNMFQDYPEYVDRFTQHGEKQYEEMKALIAKRMSAAGESLGRYESGASLRSRFSIFRGKRSKEAAVTPRASDAVLAVHPLPVVHVNVSIQSQSGVKPEPDEIESPAAADLPGVVPDPLQQQDTAEIAAADDTCVTDLSSFDDSHDAAEKLSPPLPTEEKTAEAITAHSLIELVEFMAAQHTRQMEVMTASLEEVAHATANIAGVVETGRT